MYLFARFPATSDMHLDMRLDMHLSQLRGPDLHVPAALRGIVDDLFTTKEIKYNYKKILIIIFGISKIYLAFFFFFKNLFAQPSRTPDHGSASRYLCSSSTKRYEVRTFSSTPYMYQQEGKTCPMIY